MNNNLYDKLCRTPGCVGASGALSIYQRLYLPVSECYLTYLIPEKSCSYVFVGDRVFH